MARPRMWLLQCHIGKDPEPTYHLAFADSEGEAKALYETNSRVHDISVVELVKKTGSERKPISPDEVNSPKHYCKGNIECIDVIKACTKDLTGMEAVCTANIIKYIFRWKQKNGKVDVEKCRWYCNKLIQELENVK